ncbi:hypothetical protein AVEN_175277-1 [Araneus ventricosus]|uniref:Uncharacterized protein n=1 Tax=Araneus ventricosus TaxID=182803 RepID=A0A4Y2EY74_ARAVE|nr:hypothetical protein AVEN_175277-1 [Araneus ventricosus]
MSRRTSSKRMLSEKEILQMLHNLSETDSGSEEKSDLSQDAYDPGNESEPNSSDKSFTKIGEKFYRNWIKLLQKLDKNFTEIGQKFYRNWTKALQKLDKSFTEIR